jgi:hypothetical protein
MLKKISQIVFVMVLIGTGGYAAACPCHPDSSPKPETPKPDSVR